MDHSQIILVNMIIIKVKFAETSPENVCAHDKLLGKWIYSDHGGAKHLSAQVSGVLFFYKFFWTPLQFVMKNLYYKSDNIFTCGFMPTVFTFNI